MTPCTRARALLTLALTLAASDLASQDDRARAQPAPPPPLWGSLQPGPHPVGFRSVDAIDKGRTGYDGTAPRRIRLSVWYPAVRQRERLTLRDYGLAMAGRSPRSSGPAKELDRLARSAVTLPTVPGEPEGGAARLLELEGVAGLAPAIRTGRWPLVVIATGPPYESPLSQVVLAEYLASQGYVVGVVPLAGALQPLPGTGAPDLQAQAEDVELALAELRDWPQVRGRTALVGHGLGATAALLAAMRHPEAAALVSLDGDLLGSDSALAPLRRMPDYNLRRLRAAVLHATRYPAENEAMGRPEQLALVDSLAGPVFLGRFRGMRTGDFTIHGLLEGLYPGLWGPVSGDPALQHQRLVTTVGQFLQAQLRNDAEARSALQCEPGATDPVEFCLFQRPAPPPAQDGAWLAVLLLSGEGERALNLARDARRAGLAVYDLERETILRLAEELRWRHADPKGARLAYQVGLQLWPGDPDLTYGLDRLNTR